jgi:hypothetical protein
MLGEGAGSICEGRSLQRSACRTACQNPPDTGAARVHLCCSVPVAAVFLEESSSCHGHRQPLLVHTHKLAWGDIRQIPSPCTGPTPLLHQTLHNPSLASASRDHVTVRRAAQQCSLLGACSPFTCGAPAEAALQCVMQRAFQRSSECHLASRVRTYWGVLEAVGGQRRLHVGGSG